MSQLGSHLFPQQISSSFLLPLPHWPIFLILSLSCLRALIVCSPCLDTSPLLLVWLVFTCPFRSQLKSVCLSSKPSLPTNLYQVPCHSAQSILPCLSQVINLCNYLWDYWLNHTLTRLYPPWEQEPNQVSFLLTPQCLPSKRKGM